MKYVRKFGFILNLVGAFGLLVSYLSPFIDPGNFSFPAIVSLLYPYFLIGNILFVLLWASLRHKYILISLISLMIGWNLHGRFVQFSMGAAQPKAEEEVIRCMAYNVRWLRHVPPYEQGRSGEKIAHMVEKIRAEAPGLDLFCMEEGGHGDRIGKELGMPHFVKADKMSTWLLSRHPILRSGTLSLENSGQGFAVWADVRMHKDTFRVFGLHLKSNRITSEAEELMEDIRFRERATWIRVQDILSKYGNTTAIRAEQGRKLRAEIERSPHPVIVFGDFNDTPFSRAYQVIHKGFTDSFVAAGKGIGTTYAGQLPALRIDYVLADPTFRIISHETPRWDYSDHYPVIATLGLRSFPN